MQNAADYLANHSHLNFSTFIPGSSNQIPYQAAMDIAEHPGDSRYNPLCFYGDPGVGKTHLLHAIANRAAQLHPDAKILCLTSEEFLSDLIYALHNSETAAFKSKYQEADILLVDDIQFLAGKETTQREFLNTFIALYEQGKQVVITSDRAPEDMPTLMDALKERFGEGVVIKLEVPNKETRSMILRAKAETMELLLDEQIIDYLAENLCDSVQQIEGGLKKIRAFRELDDMSLTMENISKVVEAII